VRYFCLATDYDATLAQEGKVAPRTIAALQELRKTGRRLVLVTGRELPDLLSVFPELDLFARVVAENGALLYRPETKEEKQLAPGPSPKLAETLRRRGVQPLSCGRVIVSTIDVHRQTVLEVIETLGLELQIIFNKGSLMILPSGVNKATGLRTAIEELGLSLHNTIGVGDAENDRAFLSICECSAAVANALPALREAADIVTDAGNGEGVVQLADSLLLNDLAEAAPRLERHAIPLARLDSGEEFRIPAYGRNVLVAGESESGTSTTAAALIERLVEREYQLCVFDPEGDYHGLGHLLAAGSEDAEPSAETLMSTLRKPDQSAAVNLVGVPLERRPAVFRTLLAPLLELRSRTGRPHWIIIDEAHHVLPRDGPPIPFAWPKNLTNLFLASTSPGRIDRAILGSIDLALVLGQDADAKLRAFGAAAGWILPEDAAPPVNRGEALIWPKNEKPWRARIIPGRAEGLRHASKYAAGEIGPGMEFYFRGPEGKLNLRATNLITFVQLAAGVDPETWSYHLRRGEYSRWFRDAIRSEELALEAERIEKDRKLSPAESLAQIRRAIESRFTLPG
jgi:hydroxymethylpyrimidine pyrophosphatase-like HAD family hydrolase